MRLSQYLLMIEVRTLTRGAFCFLKETREAGNSFLARVGHDLEAPWLQVVLAEAFWPGLTATDHGRMASLAIVARKEQKVVCYQYIVTKHYSSVSSVFRHRVQVMMNVDCERRVC